MRRIDMLRIVESFRRLAIAAALGTGSAVQGQGQVVAWGVNRQGQTQPISSVLFPYSRLAAGTKNIAATYADGSIRCWGNNEYGQTDVPSDLLTVLQAAVGDGHVLVRQADGTVRAWGRNSHGQGNVPTDLGSTTAVAAGYLHSLAIRTDGGVRAWGANDSGQCSLPEGLGNAISIDGGEKHSAAVRSDGRVICWGSNGLGQCNVPADLPAATAVSTGMSFTVALLSGGSVRAWGQNHYGQCNVPANLGPVAAVSAGGNFVVARQVDGTPRCWGDYWNILPPDTGPILDGVAGHTFSAAITSGGAFRFRGWAPGYLNLPPRDFANVVQIGGGTEHTLVLFADGTVDVWAAPLADYGQWAVPADLGPAVEVAAGHLHSVALLADGTVRCWGYWYDGATTVPADLGPAVRIDAGRFHTMAIRSDGTVRCWGSNSHGQREVPTDLGTAIDIAGGAYHSIALRTNGTVRVWGDSGQGQQNVPAGLQGVIAVAAGVHHGMALRSNGTVTCWGENWLGQCNVPAGLTGVVQIAAGSRHSVALRNDGTVVCWGAGSSDANQWPHFRQSVVPPNLSEVIAIGAGENTTFAILSPSASSCANPGGAGTATVAVGGGSWQNVNNWAWSDGGGPQVPGALTDVDLGEYGSIGSLCSAQAATFTARSGSTLIVPFDGTDPDPEDRSIQVLSTANLAGRILLMASGVSTLPADLDIPVLATPDPQGSFDIIQTNVPPPPGKFLALIPAPSLKGGGTVFRLQLRDIRRETLVDPDDGIGVLGTVVAAESIDLDADGFDDLALAVDNGPVSNGSVHVLLNDGSGRMGSIAVVEAVPPSPTSLSVGDADGDGLDDVAVGVAGDSTARLFLNDGEGGLSASTVFSIDGIPLSVNVMPAEGPSVTGGAGRVLVGVSGGVMPGFGERVMFFPSTGGNAEQVVMLAASGPGAPQAVTPIVLVRRGRIVSSGGTVTANVDGVKGQGLQGGPDSGGMVAILEPDAAGNYAVTRFVPIPGVPVLMDMGDVDGDGHPEIVSANRDPVFEGGGVPLPVLTMIRGGADGFGDAIPIAPTGASAGLDVTLVDPDDDGDLDIVSVHRTVGRDSEARLIVVDVEEPGGPVSIVKQEALAMDQPQFSVRGEFAAGGGEDFLLVEEGAPPSLVEGTGPTRTFLGILPPCPGDVDGSGRVGPLDLGAVLSAWMTAEARCDLNQDGVVDGLDVAIVLAHWGPCP